MNDIQDRIAIARSRLLHQHGRTGWMVHMLILSTTVAVLWQGERAAAMLVWAAAMASITLWRAARCRAFPDDVTAPEARARQRAYDALILATGIGWGLGAIVLFPADDPMRQAFLAFIIGGTATGVVATLSPSLPTLMRALVPSLPVLGATFAAQGSLASAAIGGLAVVHCLALLAVGRTLARAVEAALRLGIEKELLAAEAERQARTLSGVVEAMGDGLALIDAGGGVRLTNTSLAQLLGTDGKPTSRQLAELAVLAGDAPREVRTDDRVIEVRSSPFPGGGAVLTLADVTERSRMEADVRAARERAEAALATRARFMARASHDLRQPLHAIGLFVGRLAEVVRGREAVSLLRRIEGSVGAMTALFDVLLDLSRLDARVVQPQPAHFRLEELLRQVTAEQDLTAAGKGVALRRVGTSAVILSDPVLLGRILRNLVSNAVNHTASGKVLVGCRRAGDTVRIQVWDTGPGIAPDRLDEAFEDFSRLRTDAGTPGLGLGLAVVRRTVHLLGHRLDVRSQPGAGSLFEIAVPLGDAAACRTLHDEAIIVERPLHAQRVLVLDDDEATLTATADLLRGWGCSVTTAASVSCLVPGSEWDLVLADLQLAGGESGLAAIEHLRAQSTSPLPAAVVTAETGDSLLEVAAAAIPILRKPASPARLRALLLHLQASERTVVSCP